MNKKYIYLLVGLVLVLVGVIKPDFSKVWQNKTTQTVSVINVIKPTDPNLLVKCDSVIAAIKEGPSRSVDGKRLASLYSDIALLISLDGDNQVIKTTEEIRQANSLAGNMLKLDIKGDYPNLAKALTDVVVSCVGDDIVALDSSLRAKATEGFNALAWACYEGSK